MQLGAILCPVPNTVIEALVERCDANHVLHYSGTPEVGNYVYIFRIPLIGFVVRIIKIRANSHVHFLLDIM